jgi:hypothetical protein
MLSGVTANALAITGTAVFKMVVSSDSMKKATATNQGSMRLTAADGGSESVAGAVKACFLIKAPEMEADPIKLERGYSIAAEVTPRDLLVHQGF